MKLIARILLTLPFILVTFLYLKLNLSDNGCSGLIELIYTVGFWVLLPITFIISVVATMRKRQSEKLKVEPYSFMITVATLLTLVIAMIYGGNLKGAKWIEAKSKNHGAHPSAQELTLRKNGTFIVYLREDDFSCYFNGNYKKFGDTINFENSIIERTNSKMTTQYLLKEKTLLPLKNQPSYQNTLVEFDIISTR